MPLTEADVALMELTYSGTINSYLSLLGRQDEPLETLGSWDAAGMLLNYSDNNFMLSGGQYEHAPHETMMSWMPPLPRDDEDDDDFAANYSAGRWLDYSNNNFMLSGGQYEHAPHGTMMNWMPPPPQQTTTRPSRAPQQTTTRPSRVLTEADVAILDLMYSGSRTINSNSTSLGRQFVNPPKGGLSEEAISKYLKTKNANADDEARDGDRKICAVCLDDVCGGDAVAILDDCGHEFHSCCLQKWLRRKNICPLCRRTAISSL